MKTTEKFLAATKEILEEFAKTFAIGAAKAKKLETANLFAKYI